MWIDSQVVDRAVRKVSTDELQQSLIDSALAGDTKARTIPQLLNVLCSMDDAFATQVAGMLARFGVALVGNQITTDHETNAITKMTSLILLQLSAPLLASVRRTTTLAGSLKAGRYDRRPRRRHPRRIQPARRHRHRPAPRFLPHRDATDLDPARRRRAADVRKAN